ncbi:hypothetical protein J5N97_007671 [Dioscorea zingiberensis]|uniref:Zinc-ribbon domain-containing protein n=1 Tax=Dioscorea zingiberensis TaxID=325984 RepID=A0A9D5DCU4_9LILI|nr:hypothetical protein J5N97_007671 [Dioscorea zingiberensis]
MAEVGVGGGAKVRVVKCPKCEKLLPELANFTVYKCGGCNATLQAKKPAAVMEASLEDPDGEKVKKSENLESSSNKKRVVSEVSSGTDFEVNSSGCRMENGLNEVAESDTRRSEAMDVLKEPKSAESRIGNKVVLNELESKAVRYQRPSKALARDISPNVSEIPKANVGEGLQFNIQNEHPSVQREVPQVQAWKGEERANISSYCGASRVSMEGIGLAPFPDEGPSNYHMKQNASGLHRVENLDQDRAELLRKLDELRDQLRRSCEVADTTRDRTPTHKRAVSSNTYGNHGHNTWFSDGSSSVNRASSHHDPFLNGRIVDMPNFYQAMQSSVPGYGEPFGSQTLGMPPFHRNVPHSQGPYNGYLYGQLDQDPVISYNYDSFYHQPACSCHQCNRHWPLPGQAPPTTLGSRRAPYHVSNNVFYPAEDPLMFGQRSYNRRVAGTSLHSHGPQTNKRATFNKKHGRSCQPIAGAAPFVVCCNCSKVLQLPSKLLLVKKKKIKLQCGSCSQVISVELDGKKLTTSVVIETVRATSENDFGSTGGMKDSLPCCDHLNQFPGMPYTGDYDSPGFGVGSTDDKLVLPSSFPNSSPEMLEKECGFNLSESEKMQGLSSSSSTSEDVESSDSMICQRDLPSSTELPVEVEVPTHAPGLPLREHFAHPLSNHVMNGPGKGSRSRRSDQEKVVSVHGNFKQNSVKDVTVAAEMDLSADGCPDPNFSHDSWEGSENRPKASKGSESFFAGLIKKSFKDFRFNQSEENTRSKVSVNGHPISDRLVKKAEKQAGTIHPGDYWYDYRAGFWGVLGHPCLGIIPPFIEEFNYPMSKSCSGGNTSVSINGRELHQKDLDLLVGRGLPPTEGCSYIVEISGKVWDEATGEELDSLGKLAPTVERVKHGFGMRAPRATT